MLSERLTICRLIATAIFASMLAIFLLESSAFSKAGEGRALVNEGTIEFGIAGRWDLDPDDDTLSYLKLSLGYYILSEHELGIKSMFGVNEIGYKDRKGIFYEYTFANGTSFLPYAGVDLMHAAPVTDTNDNKDARYTSSYIGSKFVMSTEAAIAFQYQYDYSAGKIFGPPGDRSGRNREFNLSFRLYW